VPGYPPSPRRGLFTQRRGMGILRTSRSRSSRKFVRSDNTSGTFYGSPVGQAHGTGPMQLVRSRLTGKQHFLCEGHSPGEKWLREIRQQCPKRCLPPQDSSQIHRPLVIRQEESVTPKTRRHRPTAETSFRGYCVELGCPVWCSGATNLRSWERGEGADATSLQTQAYEASASPIFCPVLWPGVGEVRAMNRY
jgi:hypothetical protein